MACDTSSRAPRSSLKVSLMKTDARVLPERFMSLSMVPESEALSILESRIVSPLCLTDEKSDSQRLHSENEVFCMLQSFMQEKTR